MAIMVIGLPIHSTHLAHALSRAVRQSEWSGYMIPIDLLQYVQKDKTHIMYNFAQLLHLALHTLPLCTALLPHRACVGRLDRDATVGPHLGLQTGDLAGGELVHAAVVRVVHVVVDGVDAAARARVAAGRAFVRGRGLGRGVRDAVAGAGAATLEGMVEADPVAKERRAIRKGGR
jgi:hypothetical protein